MYRIYPPDMCPPPRTWSLDSRINTGRRASSLGASHNKTALCEDFMKLGDINLHMNMFDFHKGYMLYNFRFSRNPRWRPMCSQTMNFALSYVID